MPKLVIFGSGRGADVAARYFASDSDFEVAGFAVDKPYLASDHFRGLPLVDFSVVQEHFPPSDFRMFVALGFQQMNRLRAGKFDAARQKGYTCASYVSSKVATHDAIEPGENCFILENNTINYDVRIGNNVVIWSACQLGDQSIIEDHAWLSSHAALAGQVTVGAYSFLGVNSTITNRVTIGRRSYIGAGALVSRDTAENSVYAVESTKRFKMDSEQFLSMLETIGKPKHE